MSAEEIKAKRMQVWVDEAQHWQRVGNREEMLRVLKEGLDSEDKLDALALATAPAQELTDAQLVTRLKQKLESGK